MDFTRVIKSLLMVALTTTTTTTAYPYTRGSMGGSPWGRDTGMVDYYAGYPVEDQYTVPEYDPSSRYVYAAQRPRINKEAMAALLNAAIDDYILNYDTYNDDDGTWYSDMATETLPEQQPLAADNSPMMQLFFNQRSSSSTPYRYSLEDLENMERRAKLEENTEQQLHALRKKSSMPILGGRLAVPGLLGQGQKEEAYDIPATSVRRPVFARTITTQPEENTSQINKKQQSSHTTTTSTTQSENKKVSSSDATPVANTDNVNKEAPSASSTEYLRNHYEALKKFLDRERETRRNKDEAEALKEDQRETEEKEKEKEVMGVRMQRRAVQKRVPTNATTQQETLSEQLASLKKKV